MYDELVKELRHIDEFAAETNRSTSGIFREAADAIEKLRGLCASQSKDCSEAVAKYLELWAKQPRWIPVTERLPLYGQDVLAVRTYGDGEKFQEVLMAHIAVWNEETGEKWWNETNITHWMPLPEPPKEE